MTGAQESNYEKMKELIEQLTKELKAMESSEGNVSKEPTKEEELNKGIEDVIITDLGEDYPTAEVSIVIMDGLDMDKVEREGLDLDDEGVYLEVFPDMTDLVGLGLTAGEVETSMGVSLGEGVEVKYLSLPKEYYLPVERGGVGYTYFGKNPQLRDEDTREVLPNGVDIDCTIVDEVSDILEDLRITGDKRLLNTLDVTEVEEFFTSGIRHPSNIAGFFVKGNTILGVDVVTVNFVVGLEGVPGSVLFSFNGLYPGEGLEEIYDKMEEVSPDLCIFMLEGVQYVNEEVLDSIITS